MDKRYKLIIGVVSILMLFSACAGSHDTEACHDTMYQVSTLMSLMSGNFDGFLSVGEFKQMGDFGMGTFEKIDGEMIMLDGTVYQARGDGEVAVAADTVGLPFAVTTHFDCDMTLDIKGCSSLQELTERLNRIVDERGRNMIYAVSIQTGMCDSLTFRSEVAHEKPYRPLAEAMTYSQRTFGCRDTGGTVVAVYFPDFFNLQNLVGWHFHFLSEDCRKGGHLLDIISHDNMHVQLDVTPFYHLYMPDSKDFNDTDHNMGTVSEIEAVEK